MRPGSIAVLSRLILCSSAWRSLYADKIRKAIEESAVYEQESRSLPGTRQRRRFSSRESQPLMPLANKHRSCSLPRSSACNPWQERQDFFGERHDTTCWREGSVAEQEEICGALAPWPNGIANPTTGTRCNQPHIHHPQSHNSPMQPTSAASMRPSLLLFGARLWCTPLLPARLLSLT